MKRTLTTVGLCLSMISAVAAAGSPAGWEAALPGNATVTETKEADLNADGRAEIIVGYTLPREGRPPTEGRVAVLEREQSGGYRRFDLEVAWPGHYPPQFAVLDVTGDKRPELLVRAAGGTILHWLAVYRRSNDKYEQLLWTAGLGQEIWDVDGDGTPDIISRYRVGSQADQALQRFRWLSGRFVAWHAPQWSYVGWNGTDGHVPNLIGLSPEKAQTALIDANLNLGAIAEIDTWAPPGRVIRQSLPPGALPPEPFHQVHVAVGAGDTRFKAVTKLPQIDRVLYQAPTEAEPTHVGPTISQTAWLSRLIEGVQQVVHTRDLRSPAYFIRLTEPWQVSLGGQRESIRWIGIGVKPPDQGLLYLGTDEPRPDYHVPQFKAALYTRTPVKEGVACPGC